MTVLNEEERAALGHMRFTTRMRATLCREKEAEASLASDGDTADYWRAAALEAEAAVKVFDRMMARLSPSLEA